MPSGASKDPASKDLQTLNLLKNSYFSKMPRGHPLSDAQKQAMARGRRKASFERKMNRLDAKCREQLQEQFTEDGLRRKEKSASKIQGAQKSPWVQFMNETIAAYKNKVKPDGTSYTSREVIKIAGENYRQLKQGGVIKTQRERERDCVEQKRVRQGFFTPMPYSDPRPRIQRGSSPRPPMLRSPYSGSQSYSKPPSPDYSGSDSESGSDSKYDSDSGSTSG